jgi:hypothetical protein
MGTDGAISIVQGVGKILTLLPYSKRGSLDGSNLTSSFFRRRRDTDRVTICFEVAGAKRDAPHERLKKERIVATEFRQHSREPVPALGIWGNTNLRISGSAKVGRLTHD